MNIPRMIFESLVVFIKSSLIVFVWIGLALVLLNTNPDFFDKYFVLYGFQGWDDFLQKCKTEGCPRYLPAFEKVFEHYRLVR